MTPIFSGPPRARIMIVGEAPGREEKASRQPFVGASGYELTKMLAEAGIDRSQCFITNCTSERPPDNDIDHFFYGKREAREVGAVAYNGRFPKQPLLDGINTLFAQIEAVKPEIIIAFGNTPLWALTGHTGIMAWRGSQLRLDNSTIILPTIHPAAVLRDWTQRFYVVADLKRAASWLKDGPPAKPRWRFQIRPTFDQVLNWFRFNEYKEASHIFAADIETRGGQIACVGIAPNKGEALCIPFQSAEKPEGYWTEAEELQIVLALRRFMTNPRHDFIFHNGHFDTQYFAKQWGYIPRIRHDTMVMQHVAFSGMRKSLALCSSLFCDYHVYWKDDGKFWTPDQNEEQYWSYNCEDCVRTYEIWEKLGSILQYLNQEEQYRFQMHDLWPEMLTTMLRGVAVDTARRASYDGDLDRQMQDIERWFETVLGHKLNPRSGPQMQKLFYDELRVPPIKNRKTGAVTCDDKALDQIKVKYPLLRPLCAKISDYRSLGVFLSTFIRAPLDGDDRMRCSYNITGTETYRFSSSSNPFGVGTNLQNVPAGDE